MSDRANSPGLHANDLSSAPHNAAIASLLQEIASNNIASVYNRVANRAICAALFSVYTFLGNNPPSSGKISGAVVIMVTAIIVGVVWTLSEGYFEVKTRALSHDIAYLNSINMSEKWEDAFVHMYKDRAYHVAMDRFQTLVEPALWIAFALFVIMTR